MIDLTRLAADSALDLGATYADARIVETQEEWIEVKNGKVEGVRSSTDLGLGVRVIANGSWGFAATSQVNRREAKRIASLAARIARASAQVAAKDEVSLSSVEPVQDSWASQFSIDPFEVPLEDKINVLLDADQVVRQQEGIRVSTASMGFRKEKKYFVSSEGAEIEQELVDSGGQLVATAVDGTEVQTRSFPSALDGLYQRGGYEVIEEIDLPAGAEQAAREAVKLLTAKRCPSGEMTLILGGSQVALQVHESCGHPVELDRVLGTEISLAGSSFLTTDKLGTFRYGSELVNITADATVPGGLGTFGYDDEGVPAQRTEIVKDGIFSGYLTSRETASTLGQTSSGAMRADGWARVPLIRMTNINLEPGDWTLEEMIEDTKHGIFMESTKSWSIDDFRLNFQFAAEIAWEIVDGSLGDLVRNATYQGITPQFWGSCDAIANRDHWKMWGVTNCGKGEPMQVMRVGHGAAPARFSKVKVGIV